MVILSLKQKYQRKLEKLKNMIEDFKNSGNTEQQIAVSTLEKEKEETELLLNAINKQEPLNVVKGAYCEENDHYDLTCPICNSFCGLLENEDGDGEYKHNLAFNWCPECGQKVKI